MSDVLIGFVVRWYWRRVALRAACAALALLLAFLAGRATAQQLINLGSGPNTGTGDTALTAFGKVNANFNTLGTLFSNPFSIGTSLYPIFQSPVYTANITATSGLTTFTCNTGCGLIYIGANIFNATAFPTNTFVVGIAGATITGTVAASANFTGTVSIGFPRWDNTSNLLVNVLAAQQLYAGQAARNSSSWSDQYLPNACTLSSGICSLGVSGVANPTAAFFGMRSSDSTASSAQGLTNTSWLGINDNTSTPHTFWTHYIQTEALNGSAAGKQTFGSESSLANYNTAVQADPFTINVGRGTINQRVDCGYGGTGLAYLGTYTNCTTAVDVAFNGAAYETGILFGSTALDTGILAHPPAIALPAGANGYSLSFYRAAGYSTPSWQIYSDNTTTNGNTLILHDSSAAFNVGLSATGLTQLNVNNNAITNIGTGSTASAVNIGGGSGPVNITGSSVPIVGAPIQLNVSQNNATSINTGTSNGTVTIGGGSGTVAINDIFNATGTTSINASNNAVSNIGTGTTASAVNIGGGSNPVNITGSSVPIIGAPIQLNVSQNNNTSLNTGTSNGTVTIGGGSGTATIVATTNINASNNQVTNIGTGTTTSAVNIGNGTGNNAVSIGNGTGKVTVQGPLISAAGTRFSVASGTGACGTTSTLVGGVQAGDLTCTAATAASTVTLTLVATTTAYACWGRDITTPTTVTQTGAKSTTSVTLTLTSVTQNDVIQFGCLGY